MPTDGINDGIGFDASFTDSSAFLPALKSAKSSPSISPSLSTSNSFWPPTNSSFFSPLPVQAASILSKNAFFSASLIDGIDLPALSNAFWKNC